MRIRRALTATALVLAAGSTGAVLTAAPANAGVLGCVGSALVLQRDLKHDALHAVGSDVASIALLVAQLAVDVLTLNVTDIQGQAEYVVFHAADGTLHVAQDTVNDAQATLTACRAH